MWKVVGFEFRRVTNFKPVYALLGTDNISRVWNTRSDKTLTDFTDLIRSLEWIADILLAYAAYQFPRHSHTHTRACALSYLLSNENTKHSKIIKITKILVLVCAAFFAIAIIYCYFIISFSRCTMMRIQKNNLRQEFRNKFFNLRCV